MHSWLTSRFLDVAQREIWSIKKWSF